MRFRKDARLDQSQVEDLRGRRVGGTPMALGGGGILTIIVVLAVILLGGNLGGGGGLGGLDDLAGQTAGTGAPASTLEHCQTGADANEYEDCRILAVVNSVQKYWTTAFRGYEPARTRFFDGAVSTACGTASSSVGPFYCPPDRYVYIDLGFFDELESFGGSSRAARAGVRARPRVRPPRAEPHRRPAESRQPRHRPSGRRGPRRAAGRLLRGRLGRERAPHRPGRGHHSRGHPGRADLGGGDRRRSHPGEDPGPGQPRDVDARLADQRQSWFVRGIEGGTPNSCDTFRGRV